jgi:uncharacterized membrane protein YhaH (DUF805 family)
MGVWEVLVVAWVIMQVPLVALLARRRKAAAAYSGWLGLRMFIPFGRGWEDEAKDEDLPALRAYRRFLLAYFYLGILIPVVLFYITLHLRFS